MNKLPCEVVRDLLPSYVDGLTSETTNRLVDGHIEDCAPCRAALRAMRAPESPAADGGAEKEIDFLKKNKSKNRAVLLWSLAAAVFVVAAVLLTRAFVVGEMLSEHVALCDVQVDGNQLSVELSTMDSARVVKGVDFTESDGVVTLSARTVLADLLRGDDCYAEYAAAEKTVTAEEATAFFGQDIKSCGSSPRLLSELMMKAGLGNYGFADAEFMADGAAAAKNVTWVEVVNFTDAAVTSPEIFCDAGSGTSCIGVKGGIAHGRRSDRGSLLGARRKRHFGDREQVRNVLPLHRLQYPLQ